MSYNISKELFEAVMDIKDNKLIGVTFNEKEALLHFEDEFSFYIDNNIISYVENDTWKDISINDFFFKCKEWAFDNRYVVTTIPSITEKEWKKYAVRLYHFYNASKDRAIIEYTVDGWFKSDSEQQAVFDACQWILENKEK